MKTRWWLAIVLLVALVCVAGGAWFSHKVFGPEVQVVEKVVTKEVPKETVRYVTQTKVQYVPKEVDKVTGKVESTDVEATLPPPKVTVKVNGKPQEFDLVSSEDQKFDKGKLVLEQVHDLNIQVQVPTPPVKKYQVDVGYGNNGPAVGVHGRLGNSDVGWWLHGDKESQSIGLSIRF